MIELFRELAEFDDDIYRTSDLEMQELDEMANVRGKSCKIDDIDFSFYFSRKNSNHAIRLKILWNREKTLQQDDGYIELHGDYRYYASKNAQYVPKRWEVRGLQYFCKKYKVLFSAVWEMKLSEEDLADYFKGYIDFNKLMTCFGNISEQDFFLINHCKTIKQLEECVREHNIFNMND